MNAMSQSLRKSGQFGPITQEIETEKGLFMSQSLRKSGQFGLRDIRRN